MIDICWGILLHISQHYNFLIDAHKMLFQSSCEQYILAFIAQLDNQ